MNTYFTHQQVAYNEKNFQQYISENQSVQANLKELLGLNLEEFVFEKEVTFLNGITSDFILINKTTKTIGAIIECKKANIGVTEYVRGIGQLLQYEFFQDKKISPKKFLDSHYLDTKQISILVLPSDFMKETSLNIGYFKYPKSTKILEIHIQNHLVREITTNELEEISDATTKGLLTYCQYYIRDNRLFEILILINILNQISSLTNIGKINRKSLEENILTKYVQVINNGNWRNAFITLSSLGFIDNNNKLRHYDGFIAKITNQGMGFFINAIYENYISFFIDEIFDILLKNSNNNKASLSNQDICKKIKEKHNNRDILYLTESESRYISSWLNIMRDDLGCIDFNSRDKERTIVYNPSILTSESRVKMIEKHSKGIGFYQQFIKNKSKISKKILEHIEDF